MVYKVISNLCKNDNECITWLPTQKNKCYKISFESKSTGLFLCQNIDIKRIHVSVYHSTLLVTTMDKHTVENSFNKLFNQIMTYLHLLSISGYFSGVYKLGLSSNLCFCKRKCKYLLKMSII